MGKKLLLTAAVLTFGLTLAAYADCTTENVAGVYGFVGFGTIGANPFGLPAGTYSAVGTLAFDGKGNLLITNTARIDDLFLPPDATYQATYTVDRHCAGSFTITSFVTAGVPGPHFRIVFVDNRKGTRGISLIHGWIVNFVNTTRIEGGN